MTIAVVGLGYVGRAVVGAASGRGFEVYAYELDESVIQKIQDLLLLETYGTDGYLYMTLRESINNVHFSNVYDENLTNAGVKFICVDTINVPAAIQMIAPYVKENDVVIVESTIEVEIADLMKDLIELHTSLKCGENLHFALVPERVMEGKLLQNFESMPRSIGTINRESFKIVKKVYEDLGVKGKMQYADLRHATASKDFENAFRMLEISIANEFADICREKGLSYNLVKKLVNAKGHKMGYNQLLDSGIGIGGPCVPMAADIVARMDWENANLLRTAIEMNLGRPKSIASAISAMLIEHLGSLEGEKIAIFGATYRPNGVDVRDSPAAEIIAILAGEIGSIYIYDPLYQNGTSAVEKLEPAEIEEEFDAIVILVGHDNFKDLSMMKCDFFIDVTGVVKKYPKRARRKKLQV